MNQNASLPFPDESQGTETKRIARIDVRGKEPNLWKNLRPKLIEKIQKFLDTTMDHERGTTIQEEAKQFTSALLDFARNKLAREGVEVQKIEAEVSEIYAKRVKSLAEADKVSAEAAAIRQRTATKELCTMLAMTRAMLVGEEGEEALLLGKQINEFLGLVRELGLIQEA